MFGFLKDKLKKAVEVFTKATTEEEQAPVPELIVEEKAPKVEQQKEPAKEITKPKPEPKPEAKPSPKPEAAKPTPKVEQPKHTPAEVAQETPKVVQPKPEPVVAQAKATVVDVTTLAEAAVEKIAVPVEVKKPSAAELLAEIETDFDDDEDADEESTSVILPSRPEPVPQKPTPAATATAKQATKDPEPRTPVLKVETKEEKGGFFDRLKAAVTSKKISREEFENLFTEMEIDLLENNVALAVVDKIREDLWEGLSGERFSRFSPEKRVAQALHESMQELFLEPFDIIAAAKAKPAGEPYVICAVGVNGSGKTTSIGKLAKLLKDAGLSPVMAAGDTFRAAAIQQLEEHAKRVGVPIIKQQYGADAAAVAFDAIAFAKAHGNRVVLIDTAGRLHSNTNLMEELKKVVRVSKPDVSIFIGEATTGNDCVDQAVEFQKAVAIDGIILSKVDVDERGGAALSISYVTRKPILFFGTGQRYEDLEAFDKEKVLKSLEI